ncbi:hypothetical protein V5N11_005953 [Cardamine amara subsp. amara]|uniref:Uncharacterized protein n=1 Tax=Cardamine amara subsp. amara TaxID=228776 RepID=A0ABD0Z1E1_CARAN
MISYIHGPDFSSYLKSLVVHLEACVPKILFIRRSLLLRRRTSGVSMADNIFDAISSLSLEDDEPLELPDSPRFRVFDENAMSILGRLLNPDIQIMTKMIEAMPRVWRMVGRVRGIDLGRTTIGLCS